MSIEMFTIGHSNHSLERFLDLLRQHGIGLLADIRRFPGSRRCPHFSHENLSKALAAHDIAYCWIEALGGRRSSAESGVADSPNQGLRNRSFRNYADYMMTDEFRRGFEELSALAASKRTAMMCSESVFWRCHRRLVSDHAVARGVEVHHIFPSGEAKPHSLMAEAIPHSGGVCYPEQRPLLDD